MLRLPRNKIRDSLTRMVASGALVLTALLLAGSLLPCGAGATQGGLAELPITFPVQSPEVAAFFHEIAGPQDMASVPPAQLFLLHQDTVGQKLVGFRSFADAQQELDALSSPVDMIMYNPEHWEFTPESEQQDLADTVRQFADFAHDRDLGFMFAPDRRYAETYLGEVASDVDAVMLQGQRLQHDPQTFAAWVTGMAELAHAANPEIMVFVQVGATRGTATEMYDAIETVAGDIDGIAVWSMPRTLDILQEFVALVREGAPTTETGPSATPEVAPAEAVVTEGPTALPPTEPVVDEGAAATSEAATSVPVATQGVAATPTVQGSETQPETSPSPAVLPSATPAAQPSDLAPGMGWVTDVLLFVGGMGLGLVIGLLLGWSLKRGSRG
jgi:hypothetical protein